MFIYVLVTKEIHSNIFSIPLWFFEHVKNFKLFDATKSSTNKRPKVQFTNISMQTHK